MSEISYAFILSLTAGLKIPKIVILKKMDNWKYNFQMKQHVEISRFL